jgi:hypothetical protein
MRISLRRHRRPQAWLVIGALLFAQIAAAAQPCAMPAMALAMMNSADANSQPCEDMNANVCLAQLLQTAQATDSGAGAMSPPAYVAPFAVAVDIVAGVAPPTVAVTQGSDRPIRTRLCRLII